MNDFKIKITQDPSGTEVNLALNKQYQRLTNFKLFHYEASILLDRWTQKNIKSEGSDLGSDSWLPFKKRADGRRGRWIAGNRGSKGYLDTSASLLDHTGKLKGSYRDFHNAKEAGVGSWLDYAKIHEDGKGVPVRRVLPTEPEIRTRIMMLLQDHFTRATT